MQEQDLAALPKMPVEDSHSGRDLFLIASACIFVISAIVLALLYRNNFQTKDVKRDQVAGEDDDEADHRILPQAEQPHNATNQIQTGLN